ncbi:MAG: ABC transporter permease subunit [Planctomycetota bacterium]
MPRSTRRRVHTIDRVAETVITLGGFSVLAAVLGICVFLAAVAVPLFRSGSLEAASDGVGGVRGGGATLLLTDEYLTMAMAVDERGRIAVRTIADGALVDELDLAGDGGADGPRPTAWSRSPYSERVAIGYDDGSVRLGRIGFDARRLDAGDAPDGAAALDAGGVMPAEIGGARGLVQQNEQGDLRFVHPVVDLEEATRPLEGSAAIARIDHLLFNRREFVAAIAGDGSAAVSGVRKIVPLGGGPPRVRLQASPLDLQLTAGEAIPDWVFVLDAGDSVVVLWRDGRMRRHARGDAGFELADDLQLGAEITSAEVLLGDRSVLVGGADGYAEQWFAAPDPDAPHADGRRLVRGSRLRIGDAPVEAIGISRRDRSAVFAAGRTIRVRHLTSGQVVASVELGQSSADAVALSPRGEAVIAVGASVGDADEDWGALWTLTPGHPKVTFGSMFGRTHFEGELEAGYSWQSSAATDQSEPKLSLMPMIFGTLKATVFAMLFAVPVAVGAAIYTSEFLDRRIRRVVKPAVEVMASLPSVVLGFVAAIVLAPYARDWLPSVLVGLAIVPFVVMLAAHAWQLVPQRVALRTTSGRTLALLVAAIALGVLLSAAVGPIVERTLFAPSRGDVLLLAGSAEPVAEGERPGWVGSRDVLDAEEQLRLRRSGLGFDRGVVVRPVEPEDAESLAAVEATIAEAGIADPSIRRWLDGEFGGAGPGWFLVCVPFAIVLVAGMSRRLLGRGFNDYVAVQPRSRAALLELVRFVVTTAAVLVVAAAAAWLLAAFGQDPRTSIFGPFQQRNTLVVGIIMGLAVIPIIYTISEDALSSVPNGLRSASLGAGATRWQTVIRVVLPVAASGIFSACMIGLGRAVGETMIVLMATGNTATMNWNIFEGMRTLSANIAVELPEAARGGTHYRVLFLCGLVLFVMTFVINTSAEVVRQYYRKRNAAL